MKLTLFRWRENTLLVSCQVWCYYGEIKSAMEAFDVSRQKHRSRLFAVVGVQSKWNRTSLLWFEDCVQLMKLWIHAGKLLTSLPVHNWIINTTNCTPSLILVCRFCCGWTGFTLWLNVWRTYFNLKNMRR